MCNVEEECRRLVPLAEGGAAVGTPSLTQSEAEQDADGEEEDGAQNAQTGEVVLQDADSAGWTASYYHHGGLDDVGAGVGLLGHRRCRRVPLSCGVLVGRRGWGRNASIAVWLLPGSVLVRP